MIIGYGNKKLLYQGDKLTYIWYGTYLDVNYTYRWPNTEYSGDSTYDDPELRPYYRGIEQIDPEELDRIRNQKVEPGVYLFKFDLREIMAAKLSSSYTGYDYLFKACTFWGDGIYSDEFNIPFLNRKDTNMRYFKSLGFVRNHPQIEVETSEDIIEKGGLYGITNSSTNWYPCKIIVEVLSERTHDEKQKFRVTKMMYLNNKWHYIKLTYHGVIKEFPIEEIGYKGWKGDIFPGSTSDTFTPHVSVSYHDMYGQYGFRQYNEYGLLYARNEKSMKCKTYEEALNA